MKARSRPGGNKDAEEDLRMDQMTLFPLGAASAAKRAAEPVPIRSGRVGPVRFGATEAAYAMTRAALVELAALDGDGDDPFDR